MHQKNDYSNVTAQCFINAPFERLQNDLLDLFLTHRFQPEIGLEGGFLWELEPDDFKKIANEFHSRDLQCTLHAPFHDLVPGGFDSRIVELCREKLRRAFALTRVFKPQSIVCHLGFEENKHGTKMERWLETSVATWTDLIKLAESAGTRVMFENTYETTPAAHKQLFAALESKNIGFCMDTGHLMAFAGTGWQPWLAELEPWLGQLHLHDNNGKGDAHRAVGEGIFDFYALFQHLRAKKLSPLVTLEPHTEQDLWLSLQNIERMKLLDNKNN
jgi:sugar phosphate isomerase/epimerase